MTVLDRAFIKAYQKRQPDTAATSAEPAPEVREAPAAPLVEAPRRVDPSLSQSWSIDTASLPSADAVAEEPVVQADLWHVNLIPAPASADAEEAQRASVVPAPHIRSWAPAEASEHTPVSAAKEGAKKDAAVEAPAMRIDGIHPAAESSPHMVIERRPAEAQAVQVADKREERKVSPPIAKPLGPQTVHSAATATSGAPAQGTAVKAPPITGAPAKPNKPAIPIEPPANPPLRANYEVDQIRWPEISNNLLSLSPDGFDAMLERLMGGPTKHPACLITSCRRGEGRKIIMSCLARRLAQKGQRVLLVDADFEKAGLAQALRLSPAAGWDDVVRERMPIEEALVESISEPVTVMPMRQGETGMEMSLLTLVERARFRWDAILVDAGPMDTPENLLRDNFWKRLTDARALVVRNVRGTEVASAMQVGRHLESLGIRNWFIAENFAG